MDTLLLVLDLIGTFVFALSGATAGVKSRLDLFGVLGLWYPRNARNAAEIHGFCAAVPEVRIHLPPAERVTCEPDFLAFRRSPMRGPLMSRV